MRTWAFVTVVQDGVAGTRKIYVNGVLANSDASPAAANGTGSCDIGYGNISDEYFGGKIDDVRIYNRALTANEVQQLYLMGK